MDFKTNLENPFFSIGFLSFGGFLFWSFLTRTIQTPTLSKTEARKQVPSLPLLLDRILQPTVNKKGLVDYSKLRKSQKALDRYLSILAQVSPTSDPDLFPTRNARLAYWINAYNASVLKNVLLFPGWKEMFSHWRKFRFFMGHRFVYGGEKWNLLDLENKLIRPHFKEPLIHFAINCASFGCPNLPQTSFRAKGLQARLQREARLFFSQKRNLRVDEKSKTVYLSSILFWFRSDFLQWGLTARQRATLSKKAELPLLVYINQFRASSASLKTCGYTVKYNSYDWRLNAQHGPSRDTPLRR